MLASLPLGEQQTLPLPSPRAPPTLRFSLFPVGGEIIDVFVDLTESDDGERHSCARRLIGSDLPASSEADNVAGGGALS